MSGGTDRKELTDMDAMTALKTRQSYKADSLSDPAPDDVTLTEILQTATSAPDHGAIRPWRFIVMQGKDRDALGDLFVEALKAKKPDASEEELYDLRAKPMRSPMIVAVYAEIMENHPKVPPVEQICSTAMAAENILLTTHAKGYGAILVTGWMAHDETVKAGLGLASKDELIGFIYLGTPPSGARTKNRPDVSAYIREWKR